MPRLQPIDRANAPAETQKLLDGVEKKLGMLPNMISTMAQSRPVVQAFLGFSQALSSGVIPDQLSEQISLTVAETNGCSYCLAAHSAIGSSLGLTECEIVDARSATSTDRKTETALQFARSIVENRGGVADDDIEQMRSVGYGEQEIAEVIAHVALNTFTNFFNRAAQVDIDFPAVPEVVCD